jgi:hypothetical protein
MQCNTVYLCLETALHVSVCISTHHQEHTQNCVCSIWCLSNRYCYLSLVAIVEELGLTSTHHQDHTKLYLQYLLLVKPLLLPAAIVEELEHSDR